MDSRKVNGRRVFLSGPMTGLPDMNRPAFVVAHAKLVEMGALEVFDPAMRYVDVTNKTREWYIRRCLHHITWGEKLQTTENVAPTRNPRDVPYWHLLVSLPGWKMSRGAQLERLVAEECGIECVDWEE